MESPTVQHSKRLAESVLVWTTVTVVLCLGRLNAFDNWFPFNSDEAQAGANVLRLLGDPIPWRSVNGQSNGPANFFVLMLPYLFGQSISLYWERVIGVSLVSGALVCLYWVALRYVSRPTAAILLAFPALFYATTTHVHFLHYHSELVPVFLISLSLLLAFRLTERYSFGRAFALLNVAVVIPFGKIQAVLFSLLFQAFALWFILRAVRRDERGSRALRLLGYLLILYLPVILFFVLLISTGAWSAFLRDYIYNAAGYIKPMLQLRNLYWLANSAGVEYRGFVLFSLIVTVLGAVCSAFAAVRGIPVPSRNARTMAGFIVAATIVIGAVCWWTIVRPGMVFEHYLYFSIVPLFLLMVSAFAMLRDGRRSGGLASLIPAVISGAVLLGYAQYIGASRFIQNVDQVVTGSLWRRLHDGLFPRGAAWASWILPSHGPMFVWGREPEWYIFADAYPISRLTVGAGQLSGNPALGHQVAAEVEVTKPIVIVDAVARTNINFKDPASHGLQADELLADRLRTGYVLMNPKGVDLGCPKMYVERHHLAGQAQRWVTVKGAALESSFSASPEDGNVDRLFDRSTFEKCGDFWTFEKSADPRIVLDFDDTPLRRVGILNSFGEPERGNATKSLRLFLRLKGALVLEREVSLEPFPRWTWVELPRPLHADRIELSMLSGDGEKVSLNEVLIER